MYRFKKLIDTVRSALDETSQKIKNVIKENEQYINAIERVSKEFKEGINALKTYASIETPSLESAINALGDLFAKIEEARAERVQKLREKYIQPFKDLIVEAQKLSEEIKERDKARKELEKAKKNLEKEKAKEAKGKPADIAGAEAAVKEAEKVLAKEEAEAKEAAENFNKSKFQKIQNIINALTEIEKEYHEKILKFLETVKQKAAAINIEEAKVEIPEEEESSKEE
ncbi:MAG: BAR domain-containing protein [Promethearchaeota archaeon]